jgi:hypothetical protein
MIGLQFQRAMQHAVREVSVADPGKEQAKAPAKQLLSVRFAQHSVALRPQA